VDAASDISWSGPPGTFNLRVAAVITRSDQVLVCTVDGLGYWFLPGGRIRFGEPSDTALARELAEELGHDLPGAKLALVVENIFETRSLQHEIGDLDFRPAGLTAILPDLGGTLRHVVLDRLDRATA
jgi:8-oxo-dGTP pyrophosphatase MutT (NUDIX family)